MNYILNAQQVMFAQLAAGRMKANFGASLLIEGPPGSGKTAYAEHLAQELGAEFLYYSCSEFGNTDLLYQVDVNGVVTREKAWVKGPAWEACELSADGKKVVLLIDELDKAASNFDAFLLRFLERWTFDSPERELIKGNPKNICVVLTTNGRRTLRSEVLRRCQRIHFPYPSEERLRKIIYTILNWDKGQYAGLVQLAAKIGVAISKADAEEAPSPKELAFLCLDAMTLTMAGNETTTECWQELGRSYLVKSEPISFVNNALTKAGNKGFKWWQALKKEAQKCVLKGSQNA